MNPRTASGRPTRLQVVGGLAIAGQGLHFLEERHGRFYEAFPARLGLERWSAEFFVAFTWRWPRS